jgi:sulfur-oxidizing protein SoxX
MDIVMKASLAAVAALSCLFASPTMAQQTAKISPERVEQIVKDTWKKPAEGWQSRVDQDETQKVCSQTRNEPNADQAKAILAREKAAVVFPADGNVMGDWKKGERVANTGTGGQFTDKDDTYRGGNCYACHQMAAKELSYGTLGPSLLEYGKNRKFKPEEAKDAYAKIYNAQSVQPCSNMPRFGHNKFLSEQQMKDVTAYLFDPESPVNKP